MIRGSIDVGHSEQVFGGNGNKRGGQGVMPGYEALKSEGVSVLGGEDTAASASSTNKLQGARESWGEETVCLKLINVVQLGLLETDHGRGCKN